MSDYLTHLTIGERRIGPGEPTYIIAEAGINHNGNPEIARRLIDISADCGVDAVKFQKRDNRALYTRAMYDSIYDNRNSYGPTYGAHREA